MVPLLEVRFKRVSYVLINALRAAELATIEGDLDVEHALRFQLFLYSTKSLASVHVQSPLSFHVGAPSSEASASD